MADPDIRLQGETLICFPCSISRLFRRWRGPKSVSKLDGGHGRTCPLDPPLRHGRAEGAYFTVFILIIVVLTMDGYETIKIT